MDGNSSLNSLPPLVQRFENLDGEGQLISNLTWRECGWTVSTVVYDLDQKECSFAEIEIVDPYHGFDPTLNGWQVLKQRSTEVISRMEIPEGWILRAVIFDSDLESNFCTVTFIKIYDPHHESKVQCA